MVLVMLTVFYASFLDADSVPLRLSVILGSRLPAPLDGVLLDLLLLLLLALSSAWSVTLLKSVLTRLPCSS